MAFCNMLDEGSISKIIENDTSITPRLQILNMRKVINAISGERFRLVLSDGQFYVQGVLDKQLNELVENGKMVCFVKECSTIQQCDQGIGKPNAAPSPNQHQSRVCHIYKYIEPTIHKHKTYEQAIQQKNVQKAQPDFQPVASLNPYQTLWKIRVRCTAKDNIRTYSNQRGDGKFFGVDLLDSDGTEIRALAFNDAADKFFNIFKKNYVYLISDAVVRASRKGYTHIKNDYAITLNEDSQVIPYIDDNNEIETQKYTFVQIEQIQKCEPKSFVDVIGIVIHVSDVQTFMSKSHKQIKKRNLKIADQTAKICVTLWNEDAEHHSQEQLKDSVIALKGSRVSVYGGRTLSGGYVKINPELKETNELIQWAKHNAGDLSNLNIPELTTARYDNINVPRLTFAQVKEMKLGNKVESKHDKKHADFFTVAATITTISQSADRKPWYEANPDPKSEARNAKVVAIGDGQWKCEKNGKVYPGYTPRYILRFCATDFSGNIWLTAYDAAAQKILQTSATKLEELYNNDREQYDLIFKQAQFKKFVFKCRAWCDVWKDDKTPKYDVLDCAEIDHEHESEQLIEKIKLLENSQK